MGWSDILGAIGSAASGIGGLVGGDWGKIASGLGSLANLGGQIGASIESSDQSQHASDVTGKAADASLLLALQNANQEKKAYDAAMGLIPQETDAYNKLMSTLGPAPDAPMFDASTVDTRAQQLLPEYMEQADDAMTEMFGKDMGSLMRAGMDDSTFGIQSRAALGQKSSDLHRQVYNQAYTDALNYATGIYDEQSKAHQSVMSDRSEKIKETMDPYSTAIGDYTGIYSHTGGANADLSTAGSLADLLSRAAATGSQSAAQGAATSAAKSGLSDLWAGLKDIFGNSNSSNNTTPLPIYGDDATGGSMGGHV